MDEKFFLPIRTNYMALKKNKKKKLSTLNINGNTHRKMVIYMNSKTYEGRQSPTKEINRLAPCFTKHICHMVSCMRNPAE